MRLTPDEIVNLSTAVGEFVGKNPVELRLYGSRTDDRLKGGDIDLLLLTDSIKKKNELQTQKHLILARIKELVGEQRIDLKIAQIDEKEQDPFLQVIYPKSLLLKKWP